MFRNLGSNAQPIHIQGSATSYFSAPESELDPKLFSGNNLKGWVRNGILQLLFGFLKEQYQAPEVWAHVWIAGSGVSYQWSAARQPGDLDVLIGVDYIQFRRLHPSYNGLSDVEISRMLNEDFRNHLQPDTSDWNGYEVTFYVNPGATDIRSINPYAAYDLTRDEWTVTPSHEGAPHNRVWDLLAQRDLKLAEDIVARYSTAVTKVQNAQNDAARRNAEFAMHTALMQGHSLFEDIHDARRFAFKQGGEGYGDYYNYRWQAGKKYGTVPALKKMSEYWVAYKAQQAEDTYGVELPDTQTLIRRAATYRAKG
jgi:hypothetical protein